MLDPARSEHDRSSTEVTAPAAATQQDPAAAQGERLASDCGGDAAQLASALTAATPAVRHAALSAAHAAYGNRFVHTVEDQLGEDQSAAAGPTSAAAKPASKRGKNPIYKTKAWAADRLFDQLDNDQRALLDGLALAHPKPATEPSPLPPTERSEPAPVAATAVQPAPALEEPTVDDAAADVGPTPRPGSTLWGELDLNRRAGFLNITAAMRGNGFSLAGLGLLPGGIEQDRLLFTPDSGSAIKATLDHAITHRKSLGERGFKADVPQAGMHPGMAEWGGRQCVTSCSMQVGGGSGGVFVDIDKFNPKSNLLGLLGHAVEVLDNKLGNHKTDPFDIARSLDERGYDP